jgi:hypothetical protein
MRRIVLALVLLGACTIDTPRPTYELGAFPYHPLVYELDLAILAYQVHAQSMVWPIDPFYEEHADSRGTSRETFMALVRGWAARRGPEQIAAQAGLDAYRGPGVLAGLADSSTLDPIIYDYARIHPWSPAISNNQDAWTEYLTPDVITRRIRDVLVAARPVGSDGSVIAVTPVAPGRVDSDPDASDTLCAFEGGTGDKGIAGLPPSYSLMGYVLARDRGDGGYDVHVAFRGSRSGSAWRAINEALSENEASGNPDWVTDLGWDKIHLEEVSTVGGLDRGFAHAMSHILPGAFACLASIGEARGTAPAAIYVTGHSLGGGLAQDFASAVLLGNSYGPGGAGPAMPDALRTWPWQQLKLVTFSAPRGGDYPWATELSRHALDSGLYDPGPIETVDADARVVLDPGIVTRLTDVSRPAAFRVLISTDPITTTHGGGDGTHVGTTVYANGTSVLDWIGVVDPNDHEPMNVRADLLDAFDDATIPPVAWMYRPLEELVPDRNADERGTPAEMEKLAHGLVRYYADRGLYFDADAFTRDLELMFAIERDQAN